MRLIINGYDIELNPNAVIARTLQVNDIGSVSTRQASYTNTFNLPKTANNTKAFQMLGIVGNNSNIPYQKNECYLYSDSGESIVYKGWALITETSKEFKCNIYDGVVDLYKSIENKSLANLDLTLLAHDKTIVSVSDSQDLSKPYVYILADYNGKAQHSNEINIDYLVPSVKCSWLLQKIEEFTGTSIVGDFKTNDDFTNLYLTYPKASPPTVGTSILTSTNVVNDRATLTPNSRTLLAQVNSTTVLDGAKISIQADKVTFTAAINMTFRASFVINPTIQITRANGSFYNAFATFNGEQFLCDGTTRTINASYVLTAGQSIQFPFVVSFNNATDSNVTISDFFTSCDFKILQNAVLFEQEFGGMQIKQFLSEIIWRFNLTIFKDKYSNTYELKYLEDVINANAVDWSDKFQEWENESYIYGDYAQRNWLRYKYNDENSYFNDAYLDVSNDNLSDSKTIVQSNIFTRDFNPSEALGFSTNVYRLWDKEVKDNGDVNYKPLSNRFYFIRAVQKTGSFPIRSEVLNTHSSLSVAQIESYAKLDFNHFVNSYYPELTKLLNKSKVQSVIMRLNERDVLNFDFSRPVYIKQLGGNFLVNKISNFIPYKNTKVDIVKIGEKDFSVAPTSTINAVTDSYSFITSGVKNLAVLSNDDLGNIPTTITNIDLLGVFGLGTLSIALDGQSINFTPNETNGTDTFRYRITDSLGFFSEAIVEITVTLPPYEISSSSLIGSAFGTNVNVITGSTTIIVRAASVNFKVGVKRTAGGGNVRGEFQIAGNTTDITTISSDFVYGATFTLSQGTYSSNLFKLTITPQGTTTVGEIRVIEASAF
jgi:hypothetical protein